MAKISIYFQDLNQGAQEALREALQEEFATTGALDLSDPAADEVIDVCINRCNLANEFRIAESY